jgi:uncharacterized protein YjbI with pentapeptide repeats
MNKNFQRRNLGGYSFQGQDLSNADFSQADLRGVDFSQANLADANFYRAKLGVQSSWVIGIIAIMTVFVVIAELLVSAFAGCAIGPILDGGTFSILFACSTSSLLVGVFILTGLKRSLEKAAVNTGLATVIILVGLILIALAGGLLRFVPLTGSFSVARGLTGGVAGLFVGDAISVGIIVLSIAVSIAGNASRLGFGVVALSGSGIIILGSAMAIFMSLAMSIEGSKVLNNPLLNGGFTTGQEKLLQGSSIEAWEKIIALGGPQASLIAASGAIVIAVPVIVLGIYFGHRSLFGDQRYLRIRRFAVAIASMRGTRFQGATLERANFTEAVLKNADFTKANLTQTVWYQAELLHQSRVEGTPLSNPKIRRLVVTREGKGCKFDGQDLQGLNLKEANLEDASFIDTNFYHTDLQGANLSGALLVRTQLDQADLRQACLTGACIKNWGITKKTQLARVRCEFIYLEYDQEKRSRFPDSRDFKRGEFLSFLRPYLHSVDFQHDRNIDPKVAAIAFNHLAKQYQKDIEIVGIESQQTGVSLKVNLPDSSQSAEFQQKYQAYYQQALQMSWTLPQEAEKIAAKLNELIREVKNPRKISIDRCTLSSNSILIAGGANTINSNHQVSRFSSLMSQIQMVLQNLPPPEQTITLQQLQILRELEDLPASSQRKTAKAAVRILRGITSNSLPHIDFEKTIQLFQQIDQEILMMMPDEKSVPVANQDSSTHIGTINNNQGFVTTGGTNTFNVNQAKANLPEVAAEIQQLLNQLGQSYPTKTLVEQATVAEKAIAQIEQNPSLKERVKSVLIASGAETFKQAVNHPVIHIMVAGIEAWCNP